MSAPRKMPPKQLVRFFWSHNLWLGDNAKFDSPEECQEDDYCFACSWKFCTQRAHVLPKCEGGSDKVENIHLLCYYCHKASEHLSGAQYWEWFNQRSLRDVFSEAYISQHGVVAFLKDIKASP